MPNYLKNCLNFLFSLFPFEILQMSDLTVGKKEGKRDKTKGFIPQFALFEIIRTYQKALILPPRKNDCYAIDLTVKGVKNTINNLVVVRYRVNNRKEYSLTIQRISYFLRFDKLPDGNRTKIFMKCRNPFCSNPMHLLITRNSFKPPYRSFSKVNPEKDRVNLSKDESVIITIDI
jgi:hypothetical protein